MRIFRIIKEVYKVEQKKRNEAYAQIMMGETEAITFGEAVSLHMEPRRKMAGWSNVQACCHRLMGFKLEAHTGKKLKIYGLDVRKPLHKITTADIERLVARRYQDGYSPQTVKHEMSNLRQIVKLMTKLGYKTNPQLEIPSPKVSKTGIRYLTLEEEEGLLKELKKSKVADSYDFGLLLLDRGIRHM